VHSCLRIVTECNLKGSPEEKERSEEIRIQIVLVILRNLCSESNWWLSCIIANYSYIYRRLSAIITHKKYN